MHPKLATNFKHPKTVPGPYIRQLTNSDGKVLYAFISFYH